MPHAVAAPPPHPSMRARSDHNLALVCKSYASTPGVSHTGLSNCAHNTARVLRQNGIRAQVVPVRNVDDLKAYLALNGATLTHVVISAFWIETPDMATICGTYPNIEFAVNCHSEFGFLQVEKGACRKLRQNLDLEQSASNFHLGGNSPVFCDVVLNTYNRPCTWFPNLYYLDASTVRSPPLWNSSGGTLRQGLFGAPRKQKNFGSQVMGAATVARRLRAQSVLYINSGRNDHGEAQNIIDACNELINGLPFISIEYVPWQSAAQFVQTIGANHLNWACSYTESYNQVTADSISQGVPVVTSEAIKWSPPSWMAKVDDSNDMARIGVGLIYDPGASSDGLDALQQANAQGLYAWIQYLAQGLSGVGSRAWPTVGVPLRHQGRYAAPLGHLETSAF